MELMPSKYLCNRAASRWNHRLLLLDVIVDRAVRIHLLDVLEALDGSLDRLEIRHRAAKPAFCDVVLAAFLGGFLNALLRLLLRADKQNLPALANRRGEEVRRRFKLRERLAQINDVNAVARVEDEGLHLGVPTLRLMSKMNA